MTVMVPIKIHRKRRIVGVCRRMKQWLLLMLAARPAVSFAFPHRPGVSSNHSIRTLLAMTSRSWTANDPEQAEDARQRLNLWPLDAYNAELLNEVHPRNFESPAPHEVYDLIAIGAGAGGLVSSKQAARRGAKSALISEHLAGGDCLNVGCVPSKALIRSARAVSQVRNAAEFGVIIGEFKVDFDAVMSRVRKCRAAIAPADGHSGSQATGAHVFQGRGVLTGPNTVEVNGKVLNFKKCVIATGGRPTVPRISGLTDAPYTTNEQLFNLETLPPRMIIVGAGVIALEMAQSFALLGSKVSIINRSSRLFESKSGDLEAADILQKELEKDGVSFFRMLGYQKWKHYGKQWPAYCL